MKEQQDSCDMSESNKVGTDKPMYGRIKSLKSIDFDGTSRIRTFALQMTEETKKASNFANNNSLMLRLTSIVSEIFPPFSGGDHVDDDDLATRGKAQPPPSRDSQDPPNRTDKLRENLPQLPATPPRRSARSTATTYRHHGITQLP